MGVKPLYGTDGETVTQGLDDLDKRSARAYAAGTILPVQISFKLIAGHRCSVFQMAWGLTN